MDYLPLALGLGTFAGLVTYIEITLRREKLSGLRARQSIIDRRLLSMKSAIDRIERRLDAMTVDREVVDVEGHATYSPAPPSGKDGASLTRRVLDSTLNGPVDKAAIAKLLDDELAAMGRRAAALQPTTPSRRPCLDCSNLNAHTPDCALSMDDLVESPTDAAARRGQD